VNPQKQKTRHGRRAGYKSLVADRNANSPGLNHRMVVMTMAGMRIEIHQTASITSPLAAATNSQTFSCKNVLRKSCDKSCFFAPSFSNHPRAWRLEFQASEKLSY
jgi:hypothetical protein